MGRTPRASKSSSSAYRSSLRRLVSLSRFGSKPGLERIRKILALLGGPQKNFRCILVAGTNGKGSTTAMLAAILKKAGHRTGAYFSPSVFSFRERIQVNGRWIGERDFSRCAREALALLPRLKSDPPTFFEVMTAMALLHFRRAGVKYAVLEVGLGGRFDATNACEPALSVLTSVGLEHTQALGKTTAKIAREKAGISRPEKPLVCAVQNRPALFEIKKIARQLRAPLHFVGEKDVRAAASLLPPGSPSYQARNAACAKAAARLLGAKSAPVERALASFSMPARWEKIQSKPALILDCCHNPPGAQAIQPDLKRDFAPKKNSARILLFSSMKDKNYARVLRLVGPHFDSIVLCRPPYARAAKMKDLKDAARKSASAPIHCVPGPDRALAFAKKLSGPSGRILVCGSIYLLQYLFGEREFRMTG